MPCEVSGRISSFEALSGADLEARYRDGRACGADVLTAPLDWGAAIRCYMSSPVVYLIDAGQAAGLVEGWLAGRTRMDREAVSADGR